MCGCVILEVEFEVLSDQMGDSQENNKGKSRDKDNYVSWTMEDTNELLHLLVDAMNRGLRDANGSLSKQNVERIILPQLNAKTKFPKTYSHYLSRMKWFRNQYNMMSTLMRNNSGFGWDPIGKTFTAHEDVWKDYLKSHPSHSKLRGKSMVDYEYLKIVVGGGVSSGNNSISVDPDDTDATTFEPENRTVGIEEFSYDPNSDTFITPNNYEPTYQSPSPNQPSPPSHPPLDSEVPIEKQNCHKRRRSEYGGSSSAVGINNLGNVLENLSVGIGTIAVNFEKISNMMEKREKDRDRDRELKGIIWDVIKEIPNLDDITRFKTAELLNTKAKKDFFLKMSPEERSSWINFNIWFVFWSNYYDTNDEDIDDEETNEEFYEATYTYVMAIYALIDILNQFLNMMRGEHIERPLTRRQITSRGYDYIHKALNDDPAIFRQVYRMYPDVFRKLCTIIREKTPLEDTRFICVEEMLASFLQIVGQNTRYCVIRNTFGRSQFATSENFHKILKALNSLAPDLMVRPGSTVPAKIRESTRFYPYFKDCIGAIDGTHIPASVKGRDVSSYRDRHGNISQNVLAACNFDLEFMYVLSGWEGSAHDSKVLSDALARKNGLKVPQGKYYLVDCGFPNRRKFLAPYRGVRYHLQDFAGHGNDPENEKELFNLRHASLRNVIERIFGIFKSRFTIFKSAPPFLFKTQAELVLACAALHNFLRKECRSDEFPMEPTDESSSSSSVLPNYEDNDHEPIVQTQEQEREDANIWRTNIGSDMWRNANN
ncbi:Uncharacterized protein GmHk_18G052304 [Glycine max]|nr:Uncharacterized protein GmHk_18G052304 [Glycine max]